MLVTGDRDWTDAALIVSSLWELAVEKGPLIVIHGRARGADAMADLAARALGFEVAGPDGRGYAANWTRYGKAAGVIRNQQMLDEGKPDCALAFHDDLPHSRGTADMVRRLRKAGIPVTVVTHPAEPAIL